MRSDSSEHLSERFELRGQVRVGLGATDLLVTMAMQARLKPTGASPPFAAGLEHSAADGAVRGIGYSE